MRKDASHVGPHEGPQGERWTGLLMECLPAPKLQPRSPGAKLNRAWRLPCTHGALSHS